MDNEILLPVMFPGIPFSRFRGEFKKMSQPIRDQGGHLGFPIGPKNTNLVEDIENLLTVRFHRIPFSGFRGEVENVSGNQRPSGHLAFPDRPIKHKLGRGRFRSCFLTIPFSGFRGQVERPSCFSDRPEKNTNVVEDIDILISVKFRWIPISRFREEIENVSTNQWPGRLSWFFFINPKNTNLVEDIEILLPDKFCLIPFSGFRGTIENVVVNQRPGRPSCFSDRSEKHKHSREHWELATCQVSLNSNQPFQREVENVSNNQRPGGHLVFFDRP